MLRQPGPLVMQPLSARCMRTLLHFRMGSHPLPVVLGRRTRVPGAQRMCQQCNLHALHDERHLICCVPCHAVCAVPCLVQYCASAENSMLLFMWQRETVRVAHYIMDCFRCLPLHLKYINLIFISPGGWIDVIHSFYH